MRRLTIPTTFLAALLGATPMTTNALATPPACTAVEHRQFDFWVGEWIVTRPDTGAELGRSTISLGAGDCLVHENWRGASGYTGQSLNAWDARQARWVQHWVGSDGGMLRLEGGLQDGAMVLVGELPKTDGGRTLQRITWTPGADGSVIQHWQTSGDEGVTWTTSFLGLYRKA
jgi:hypothetical protein